MVYSRARWRVRSSAALGIRRADKVAFQENYKIIDFLVFFQYFGAPGAPNFRQNGPKTQTEAPQMQVLVGHPSLATESDEAVPVEWLLSLHPTIHYVLLYVLSTKRL